MVLQDKEINNLIEKDIVQHIREYSIYCSSFNAWDELEVGFYKKKMFITD
jgi:hypothetical protein